MRSLLLPVVLLVQLVSVRTVPVPGPGPEPYHAFCHTIWLFASPCSMVSSALEQQITALSPEIGCTACHYTLDSVTSTTILANHSSTDGLTESLSFKFKTTVLSGGCSVSAQSQSLDFSSLLDNGLNYCNLYNLLALSGLASQPDFLEMTNEWACLGYGLATCKV